MTRWMFFPNPNHVVNSDIPDLSLGWSNGFWQVFSVLMIFLAAGHGFNGLRMVLEDYIKNPLAVALLRVLMFLLWLGGMILAVYVILLS
jgi:succinate dehydrogenase hydrophobic anchor subunit